MIAFFAADCRFFFARAEPARGFVRIRMVPRPACARSLQDDRGGHLWMQGTDSDKKKDGLVSILTGVVENTRVELVTSCMPCKRSSQLS